MTIPAVMFMEAASDSLKSMEEKALHAHIREWESFGFARVQAVADALRCSTETAAYLVGIQTARVMLETMPAAIQAGVTL